MKWIPAFEGDVPGAAAFRRQFGRLDGGSPGKHPRVRHC
jgi:hypothetical protein